MKQVTINGCTYDVAAWIRAFDRLHVMDDERVSSCVDNGQDTASELGLRGERLEIGAMILAVETAISEYEIIDRKSIV